MYSATPDDIDIIKIWPGGNGITPDMVPTEIGYFAPAALTANGSNPPLNRTAKPTPIIKWGFYSKPEETQLWCIKLFRDRNQKLPHFVSPIETATQLRKHEKTAMEAVSDCLAQMYKHTMETLTRRYSESFVAMTKVEFVLTVLATWSGYGKDATLKAAEKASMGTRHELKLTSEPEAAAVSMRKTIQPNNFKVGDSLVVCDADSGTVDLLAYKITQLKPSRMEESADYGSQCGAQGTVYEVDDD